MKRYVFLALPALAVACLLSVVEPTYAQRGGGGGGRGGASIGRGASYGGYGGSTYGGYRGGYYGGYGGSNYGGNYGGWGGISIGLGLPLYGGGYYGGYTPYYSPYGYYQAPVFADNIVPATYQSFYPAQSAGDPTVASIHVRVPENAQVFFDDTPTTQTGRDRMYATGSLDAGKNYTYTISARWAVNGQERRDSRTVRLNLGGTVDVDFTAPTPLPPPQQIR